MPVGDPFDTIGMDFVELDASKQGNRYTLVFQDYLSKWLEVYPTGEQRLSVYRTWCGGMEYPIKLYMTERLNSYLMSYRRLQNF